MFLLIRNYDNENVCFAKLVRIMKYLLPDQIHIYVKIFDLRQPKQNTCNNHHFAVEFNDLQCNCVVHGWYCFVLANAFLESLQ